MPAVEMNVATPPTETPRQRIRVRGEELLTKVRELIHEGNARRIIVTLAANYTLLIEARNPDDTADARP